jgi:hypothetical protein
MMPTYQTNVEISGVDGCETTITINYTCHKFRAGRTDGRHGPKLEPDELAHIEIDSITGPNGEEINLVPTMEDAIMEDIIEYESEKAMGRYDQDAPEGYYDAETN